MDQHLLEREQFEAVLRSFSATRIPDRLLILDLFLSTEQHVSLSELAEMVRAKAPELADPEFLQETMEMFCQYGFAHKQTFESQEPRYEHLHLGTHHDHFICTRCGRIQEFSNQELERLQLAIARQYQFHPLQHKMEIYGLCGACMALRDEVIPLRLAAQGERVRVVRLLGDRQQQARLANLGLRVGSCLEVISNHPGGPFIVAVHDARLAIPADVGREVLVTHSCLHQEESP